MCVLVGSLERRAVDDKLLVAGIDDIAGADTEEWIVAEGAPGILPQLEPLQHSEILDGAEFAIAFVFEKHHVVHLAQRRTALIHRIGNALLDGSDVAFGQQRHPSTVLGGPLGVEVAQQRGIDRIIVPRGVVDAHRAAFGPFALQLLAADVIVHVVAVLNQAVLLVLVAIAVGGVLAQRLVGQRHQRVVVVVHPHRNQHRYGGNNHHGSGEDEGQPAVGYAAPEDGQKHHRHNKKHHECSVGAQLEQKIHQRDGHCQQDPQQPVGKETPRPLGPLDAEPDDDHYRQADIHRKTDMRYERNYLPIRQIRNCGQTNAADDRRHKHGADKGKEHHRQLAARQRTRREHHQRNGQQRQFFEYVVPSVGSILARNHPHQMHRHQHQERPQQRTAASTLPLGSHIPFQSPVDSKQYLHPAHHKVADRLRTNQHDKQQEIDGAVDSEPPRHSTITVNNRRKICL